MFYKKLFYVSIGGKHLIVLTQKDMSRVANYADAMIGTLMLLHHQAEEKIDVRAEFFEFMKLLKNSRHKDKFAETFSNCVKIYRCKLAGSLSAKGAQILQDDYMRDGSNDIIPLDQYFKWVSRKQLDAATMVNSFHRCLMPPDFDIPKIFTAERDLHSHKNISGGPPGSKEEALYQKFLKYNRWAFIMQFYKQFKRKPGYMHPSGPDDEIANDYNKDRHKRPNLDLDQAVRVDLIGVLDYKKRDNDYASYFKDASMCPETVSEALSPSIPDAEDTNMVAHMLYAQEKIDVDEHRKNFVEKEHPIRVAFKVESGKEDGRLFFIYNLKDKILLAEVEENISLFLEKIPGNAVGISSSVIREKMARISSLERSTGADLSPLFLSDDISKWSPHMSIRAQEDSSKFWAEVFDQPFIGELDQINVRDTVVLNTMGYRASYNSGGANKEGATGKRITYLMINMKAFCVALARGKWGGTKIIEGRAGLLTFLDDGLTQVDLSIKDYDKTAPMVMEHFRYVQWVIGYELKIPKCYPSNRYVIFLNYEYLSGKRLYDKLKSFVKLFPRKIGDLMTLSERLREVATWAIGAMESGSNHFFVFWAYIFRSCMEIAKWNRYDITMDKHFVIQTISPIALGGYAFMPLHGLATGLVRQAFVENIAGVKEACFHFSFVRPFLFGLLRSPAAVRDPVSILRAPYAVSFAVPHLTEHHVIHALEEHYLENCESIYLKPYLDFFRGQKLYEFALQLTQSNSHCSFADLECIYKASPIAYVDKIFSKIKKSTTLQTMLNPRLVSNLQRRIRQEAVLVNSAWRDRFNYL